MVIMKTQKQHKHKKPFHLHVEHVSRMPILLGIFIGLFMVALLKSDSRMVGMVREAYAEGSGLVGSYMREETVRMPVTLTTIRANTISGK